jgi:hypothetical protein
MALTASLINNGLISDEGFMTALNVLLDTNHAVVGIGDFKVTPGTGLQVQIAAGVALVYSSSKVSYIAVNNSATINQAITSNSSGSTRIDLICLKVDTTITSDSAMDNVASIQYVTGTPGGGVPATPAGYAKHAEITVVNGASSFSSGDIADKRLNMTSLISVFQAVKQASTPANPPSGEMKAYFKSDGLLYKLDSSGTETTVGNNSGLLQSIQQSTTLVNSNNSTTTYSDALSVTFTPTANVNVLIIASLICTVNVTNISTLSRLVVDGSAVGTDPSMQYDVVTVNKYQTIATQFCSTGLNTSSHTIKVQHKLSSTSGAPSSIIQSGILTVLVYNQ